MRVALVVCRNYYGKYEVLIREFLEKELKKLTIAICTYNRSENLPRLVGALRMQTLPIECEILFVNNNSQDDTLAILEELSHQPGIKLRYVTEMNQGIPYARNRALNECMMSSDFMLFMDDDEIPASIHMAEEALKCLTEDGADCVGGKVEINFGENKRPEWLSDELLPFYAEVDYGEKKFWIKDKSTPIWTSIIAYDMNIFRTDPQLRFDIRYNRNANGIGGGSDAIMFRQMLSKNIKMMYQPKMAIEHFVESWRITRRYFWKLHFVAGRKFGQFETPGYKRTMLGVPPFMLTHAFKHLVNTIKLLIYFDKSYVRQGMNFTHALGQIYGRYLRYKSKGS